MAVLLTTDNQFIFSSKFITSFENDVKLSKNHFNVNRYIGLGIFWNGIKISSPEITEDGIYKPLEPKSYPLLNYLFQRLKKLAIRVADGATY